MNLNEAFRYANHLDGLVNEIYGIMHYASNVTKTTQTLLKSKSLSTAADEVVEVPKNLPGNCTPNDLLELLNDLSTEQHFLVDKIALAKEYTDYDMLKELNIKDRTFLNNLKNLSRIKSSERQSRGTDYTFNNEGNQTSYSFDIKEVVQIDFDRNKVKRMISSLSKEVEAVSAQIAKIELDITVDLAPEFSINDTLEDIMEVRIEYRNIDLQPM